MNFYNNNSINEKTEDNSNKIIFMNDYIRNLQHTIMHKKRTKNKEFNVKNKKFY